MPINEERPQPAYSCAQTELYAGLDMVWDSQAEHEAEFIAENAKYTAGLSVTRKGEIEAAQILPDGQARYADSEDLRLQLEEDLDGVLDKWNSLDGYIKKTFTGVHYKPRVEEAGRGYYAKAYNKNWEQVKQLLQSGKAFIAAHGSDLTADGGMPAAFAAAFDSVKTDFDTKYGSYMAARQTAQEQTDVKVLANNAIYKDGREMMEDGKHIFRKNASLRERFVWEKVLSMVTPGSPLTSVVLEGDAVMGSINDLNTSSFTITASTTVKIEITGNDLRLSAAMAPGPTMGAVVWYVTIGTQNKTIEAFSALVGADEMNTFLKVQCIGPATGHYKITFNNVIVP